MKIKEKVWMRLKSKKKSKKCKINENQRKGISREEVE